MSTMIRPTIAVCASALALVAAGLLSFNLPDRAAESGLGLNHLSANAIGANAQAANPLAASGKYSPLAASAEEPGQRYGEGVVVSGAQLGAFHGMATIGIAGYAWTDEGWARVPIQIDERDAAGLFVDAEDGRLDGNDDFVFLLENAGLIAPDSTPPGPGIGPARRIQISDPLDPAFVQHLYVLPADGPMLGPPEPALVWDAVTRELRTANYVIGFASSDAEGDGYFGIKRLSLFGDEADLVDRLKFRARIASPLGDVEITEEDFGGLGDLVPGAGDVSLDIEPIIVGPVRAVLDQAGAGSAYPARATIFNALDTFELPDLGGIVDLEITDIRVSIDHSPSISGATYRDSNTPAGVTIDGVSETLAAGPLPAWREVGFPGGRMVLVASADAETRAGADAAVYWADRADGVPGDTGDGASFGDHGVTAATLSDLAATGFPGELVVLPQPMELDAELLAQAAFTPLEITVADADLDVIDPTATPTLFPAPPTPTTEPTTVSAETPVVTPDATPGGGGTFRIFLAFAAKHL